ncbi:Protein crumbs [Eumeta japonica]|uniref:Protein crumbs n=1 Tax=Eumeta variegata TaxID=151549 RepID=A0A4C1YMN5_EUMVA|nr:Protein crumbs [Eumeta japonica]
MCRIAKNVDPRIRIRKRIFGVKIRGYGYGSLFSYAIGIGASDLETIVDTSLAATTRRTCFDLRCAFAYNIYVNKTVCYAPTDIRKAAHVPAIARHLCENEIDVCAVMPKICNQGVCIKGVGSFQCYCKPGYTGDRCEQDIDECLSSPCKNGGTCQNLENNYECNCMAGFTGKDCSTNINECESSPCAEGATCVDGIASYSCVCQQGLTGDRCENNIDDCESEPCQHGGRCIDALNGFECRCEGTGYTGADCSLNIDECEPQPCHNGATCVDGLNDYNCRCYDGYTGKNCELDISECESAPCQFGGVCLERSNASLYRTADSGAAPQVGPQPTQLLPAVFYEPFSYENASGFECVCVAGTTGSRCEINIDECASAPCGYGKCIDAVGGYSCDCAPGYEGDHCQLEIDECLRYKPCEHGHCYDRRASYFCECEDGWGGRNCSVVLEGCVNAPCRNNGTCLPWLHRESEHRFNCSCTPGYYGTTCEKITTMSLERNSYAEVNTSREEGYDISFRFKTTLRSGLLAMGRGFTYFVLKLSNGRLNLHSSLLNKWEGVFIGSNLNDSNWQKVFVTINSSHLVLAANEEQTIYPISQNEASNTSQTSFPCTRLGTAGPSFTTLTHEPNFFVGCFQDVVVNGQWVLPEYSNASEAENAVEIQTEDSSGIEENETEMEGGARALLRGVRASCPRKEQCKPNPCHSGGVCEDYWSNYTCTCPRPYLGPTCQYNYTAATFGHETASPQSVVAVTVWEGARRAVRSALDISMFIRTRKPTGTIFYLGSKPSRSRGDRTCDPPKSRWSLPPMDARNPRGDTSVLLASLERIGGLLEGGVADEKGSGVMNGEWCDGGELGHRNSHSSEYGITEETLVAASLKNGELLVHLQFNHTPEDYTVGGTRLDNGYLHLIQVVRNSTLVQVKLNGTEYFRKSISAAEQLDAQPVLYINYNRMSDELSYKDLIFLFEVLYLGGPPPDPAPPADTTTAIPPGPVAPPAAASAAPALALPPTAAPTLPPRILTDADYFKGIIQDVQISNGVNLTIVEFFPLREPGLTLPPSFGDVSLDPGVLSGERSDDACAIRPCLHNATCTVTWNDYTCECPRGYKGKQCAEVEFCQLQNCPLGSNCRNLDGAHLFVYRYECLSNATFDGVNTTLTYSLRLPTRGVGAGAGAGAGAAPSNEPAYIPPDSLTITYRSKTGGTLLHAELLAGNETLWFSVGVFRDQASVQWRLRTLDLPVLRRVRKPLADLDWSTLRFTLRAATGPPAPAPALPPPRPVASLDFDLIQDATRLTLAGRIATGAVSHIGESEGFSIGCRSRHNFLQNIGRRFLPYKVMNLFPGRVLGKCRVQPEPVARSLTHRLCAFVDAEGQEEAGFSAPIDAAAWQRLMASGVLRLGGVGPRPDATAPAATLHVDGDRDANAAATVAPTDLTYNEDWSADASLGEHFKGCMGPVHVGGLLLPFFPENELFKGTSADLLRGQSHYALTSGRPWGWETALGCVLCLERECSHGGRCADVRHSYACSCPAGFSGDRCEIDVDECLQNECRNGATCQDELASYTCLCPPGFNGTFCEHDIDECESSPCAHGGTCSDQPGGFECTCAAEWGGPRCERPRRLSCSHRPCSSGHAICKDEIPDPPNGNNYTCVCLEGWEGVHCDEAFCEVRPCAHGRCGTDLKVPACECEPGYSGAYCETERDECEEGGRAACRHGALCIDQLNGFLCNCTGTGSILSKLSRGLLEHLARVLSYVLGRVFSDRLTAFRTSSPRRLVIVRSRRRRCFCRLRNKRCTPSCRRHRARLAGAEEAGSSSAMTSVPLWLLALILWWTGAHCELDVDECALHLVSCGPGECRNHDGGYTYVFCRMPRAAGSFNTLIHESLCRCQCSPGFCGNECALPDPCYQELATGEDGAGTNTTGPCLHGGVCEQRCSEHVDYICHCVNGWGGTNCSYQVVIDKMDGGGPDSSTVLIAVGAALLGVAALGGALAVLAARARRNRATRGTYSPSGQEYCNPRAEMMHNTLKPPPEERLI